MESIRKVIVLHTDPDNETNYVARFNYTINSTMKLFAKAAINREDAIEFLQELPSDPVAGNPFIDRSYDYIVGHTWTLGSTKVNQFSYGDTIEKFNFPANYAPTGTTVLDLGAAFLGGPYNEQESQKRQAADTGGARRFSGGGRVPTTLHWAARSSSSRHRANRFWTSTF